MSIGLVGRLLLFFANALARLSLVAVNIHHLALLELLLSLLALEPKVLLLFSALLVRQEPILICALVAPLDDPLLFNGALALVALGSAPLLLNLLSFTRGFQVSGLTFHLFGSFAPAGQEAAFGGLALVVLADPFRVVG